MYEVLALDMDDTLLCSDGGVDAETLALLEAWHGRGKRIVIATGRPPRSVGPSLPALLQDVPWICYNGAEVRLQGRTVFADFMEPGDVRQLVEWGCRELPTWRIGLEIDDVLYLNQRLTIAKEYVFQPDLGAVADRPAAKVLFSNGALNAETQPESADAMFTALTPLLARLPARTRPMLSYRYKLAQFMSRTADKAVALTHVVAEWGYTMEQVAAFGDDVNDVDMLRACGLGVAMANAVEEVHAAADHVTASNNHGGVAQVLRTLMP
jgi:Cof subfamily protein (haloacid dehalogenase superfamily)